MSRRVKPHQVCGRKFEEVREKDPDGRIVYHHRTVDTLGKMLRVGTIDQAMHDAAKDFQAAFIVANLDPLRALPILRVPGTGREAQLNDRQLHARRRVHKAMAALGGISSPAGSCVWHVVGLQRSVREWAIRQGWGGRPVRQEQAQGILVAALGVLAAHVRYARRSQDEKIIAFVHDLDEERLAEPLDYATTSGAAHSQPLHQVLAHLFNHQTHHRGQAHHLIGLALGREKAPVLQLMAYLRAAAGGS